MALPFLYAHLRVVGVAGAAALLSLAALMVAIEERRLKAYQSYCRARRFRFEENRFDEERRHVATCPLFMPRGHGERWGLTITGSQSGVPFVAFEYEWYTPAPFILRGQNTHKIAGIIWTLESELPQFVLTRWGLYKWPLIPLGGHRVDFDSPQEFSRYELRGSDQAAVRALFTPDIRGFFATHSREHVSGAGRELMWWRRGRLPAPAKLDAFLGVGEQIRTLFAVGPHC